MSGWSRAIKVFESEFKKKDKWEFYLLELDITGEKLNITGYQKGDEKDAILDYSRAEKKKPRKKRI